MPSAPEAAARHRRGDAVPLSPIGAAEALAQLDAFDAVIDARSPAEYAEDHAAGRGQLAVARRCRARAQSARHQQVSPSRRRSAARRWSPATSPRTSSARSAADAGLVAARLLLARRQAQRGARARARPDRLSRAAARRRLPRVPARRRGRARDAAGSARVPRGLRHHRIGQEPAAAGARRARRAGARPRGARQPPRLGARPRAGQPAADAEGVRHAPLGCAAPRSIRRGRCSSRARARRSATCACPRR